MWAYAAAVRRSGQQLAVRQTSKQYAIGGILSRTFASDDNNNSEGKDAGSNNRDPSQQQRQQRVARPNNNNNNRSRGKGGDRPRKQNFSRQFMEPAARGELQKNHQSGIPKLAGRRPKGHGVRGSDAGRHGSPMEDEMANEPPEVVEKTGTIAEGSPLEELNPEDFAAVTEFQEFYQSLATVAEKEEYYWDELDYDYFLNPKQQAMFAQIEGVETKDADGNLTAEVDDDVFNFFAELDAGESAQSSARGSRGGRGGRGGPGASTKDYAKEIDIAEMVANNNAQKTFGPDYNTVTPFAPIGSGMNDFVEGVLEHPTRYAEYRYDVPHAESTREPKADFPKKRSNPSKDFVESYQRFMYVAGLPSVFPDGTLTDFENPLHKFEIQKQIAELFHVETEQVHAASATSGFVGFATPQDRLLALEVGPTEAIIESPLTISKYEPTEKDAYFCKGAEDSILKIDNLPMGSTPKLIAESVFPPGTEFSDKFGEVSISDVMMKSASSALVRLSHIEEALNSEVLKTRLVELGQHRVRFMKARRELKFTGKHGGPARLDRLRDFGDQLIVDGDMPKKKFFLSHATTLCLRNVDPSVTKADIAKFFQPFCFFRRDIEGSVEYTTCYEGLPTGKVYVGFDELGEAEIAMQAFKSGRVRGLGPSTVVMGAVKELNKVKREQRQMRSEEELLANLYNWEQYVDPADVEELVQNGMPKASLDEVLRALRFHNPTFAANDQAMRSETLNPEKEIGGMYAEMVREYVATLKECISTKENPGPIYKSLFFKDEVLDFQSFDAEVERQKELDNRRSI